jgi:hypothetical protein
MIGMITASARHHRPCRQRNGTKPKFFNDFSRARACACAQGGVRSESAILGLGRDVRRAIGFLALCVASPAEAQGNLDQGKTAAELYASGCTGCHKSPQSVSNTRWRFALESFLSEHYTSSRQSAFILAAYLKEQEKRSAETQHGRPAKHSSQAKPSEPTLSGSEDDVPRPPADIPDVRR